MWLLCSKRCSGTMSNISRTRSTTTSENKLDIDSSLFNKLSNNEKIIVKLLCTKIDDITMKFEMELKIRDEKIQVLQEEVMACRSSYALLETRFDDQEATSKADTLIISGRDIPSFNESENCLAITHNLIKNKLKLSLSEDCVFSAHRMGKPPTTQKPDKRNILVKMKSEDNVQDIVKSSKKVKPTNLFFSENLIAKRYGFLSVLRKLKRSHPHKISGSSSIRGKIYVWLQPPNNDTPHVRHERKLISTGAQLEELCLNVLGACFIRGIIAE